MLETIVSAWCVYGSGTCIVPSLNLRGNFHLLDSRDGTPDAAATSGEAGTCKFELETPISMSDNSDTFVELRAPADDSVANTVVVVDSGTAGASYCLHDEI